MRMLSCPPTDQHGANTPTSGVYADERDGSHPIGMNLVPFRNASHFFPALEEEAKTILEREPSRPFLPALLRSLGLAAEAKTAQDSIARLDVAGLPEGWRAEGNNLVAAQALGAEAFKQAAQAAVGCIQQQTVLRASS